MNVLLESENIYFFQSNVWPCNLQLNIYFILWILALGLQKLWSS